MMNRTLLAHFAIIVLICLGTFANSLSGSFLWDDDTQIVRNPNVRSLDKIPDAFTQGVWAFTATKEQPNKSNFYRPTQTALYALTYQWNGYDPKAYHVVQIGFHVAASIFVYLVCLELGLTSALALLAAALFGVHPIHTEAIDWIAALPDLVCGTFYFAALFAFLRSRQGQNIGWLVGSAVLFLIALFSKEMAITFPLIVMLLSFRPGMPSYRWPELFRLWIKLLIPYVVATAVYVAMRTYALGFLLTEQTPTTASVADWVTLGVHVLARYIYFAFIPYPLLAYHQLPIHVGDRILPGIGALALIAALGAVVWRYRAKIPMTALWAAAFPLMLIPVFYFKGISTAVMADRYLYTPSIAAVVIIVTALAAWIPKKALWVGWGLVALFALQSMARNPDWQDAEHIWATALDLDPELATLQISMSEILLKRGDDLNAARRLNAALASLGSGKYSILPDEFYRAHVGLGAVLARAKNFEGARKHLEIAQQLNPTAEWSYLYLGGIAMEADNDIPKAIELLQKAIQLSPVSDLAHEYLGVAYFNQGRFAEAKASFESALKINPANQVARAHLALTEQSIQQANAAAVGNASNGNPNSP